MSEVGNRLRIGKISSPGSGFKISPGGTTSNTFNRFRAAVTNGDNTISYVSDSSGYPGFSIILPGQLVRMTGVGWTDNIATITSVDYVAQTLEVDTTPTADKESTLVIRPPKGQSMVISGSLSIPQNSNPLWNFNQITGSHDDDYDISYTKWGLITQLANIGSSNTSMASKYGVYEITRIYRTSTTVASFYVSASAGIFEEGPNDTISTSQTTLGIVELSHSSSLAPIFHGPDADVPEGLGFSAYSQTVRNFLDTLQGGSSGPDDDWYIGDTFLTASKDVQITGSLLVNRQDSTADFFLIRSGSYDALKVDSQGITRFFAHEDESTPWATADYGGLYYMSSSVWVAID